jgi:ribosomal protein S18 acetylase RimI-like enzyme
MSPNFVIRSAKKTDQSALAKIIRTERVYHRHLDWCSAVDWLGKQPFWIIEHKRTILAALACPVIPPEINWIRFFVNNNIFSHHEAWEILFKHCLEDISDQEFDTKASQRIFGAVCLSEWFENILLRSGFAHDQTIVSLECHTKPQIENRPPGTFFIRPMLQSDLEGVSRVDMTAFPPLWVNSIDTLEKAYGQSTYATVIEIDGQIIAYQITTASPFNLHLARLAVLPAFQNQHIGSLLLEDLFRYREDQNFPSISVNTQKENFKSIALYQKFGFRLTGEDYPVLTYSFS